MDTAERLAAADAIRNTKATYWYAMDTKDWDRLAAVFTADAIFDMRGERAHSTGTPLSALPPIAQSIAEGDPAVTVGGSAIAGFIRSVVVDWVTVHHGAAPIIDVTGPDQAQGIWPFFDFIDDGRHALRGYGHYHETYRKVDGRWLIASLVITRLRTDGVHPWSVQRLEPSGA
jgi:hypothetical protein